jgi:SAM-dependent methyltransferase
MSTEHPWLAGYKIPWHEPGFSRRMLREHLSQAHDLASRRTEWIDRQVDWVHRRVLRERPARVLDLGCGPGLYSHRLAALGHACRGVDFAPASIDYARRHRPPGSSCEFDLADLRSAAFPGPYELAMILYGEVNVFSPSEVRSILRRAVASLVPGGTLIVEAHTPEAVERIGRAEPSGERLESGVFADGPHECRRESRWLAEDRVAVQVFTVRQPGSDARTYRSTTKAWTDDELAAMLGEAGCRDIARVGGWPSNTEALALWSGEKPDRCDAV